MAKIFSHPNGRPVLLAIGAQSLAYGDGYGKSTTLAKYALNELNGGYHGYAKVLMVV